MAWDGKLPRGCAQLGILAVAVALLMIGGEFDLSIGSAIGVRHHFRVAQRRVRWNVWLAMLAALVFAPPVGRLQRVSRAPHRLTVVHHHPRHVVDRSRSDHRDHAAGDGTNGRQRPRRRTRLRRHPHDLRQRRDGWRCRILDRHRVVAGHRRSRHLGAAADPIRQLDLWRRGKPAGGAQRRRADQPGQDRTVYGHRGRRPGWWR